MADHTTTPSFRLNNADIGTVIFIVEGMDTEYKILECVFGRILGYSRVGGKTKTPPFLELHSDDNPNNRVIIIRAKGNNVKNIREFNEYFDELYSGVFMQKEIETRYSPIYYIWDRDPANNPRLHLEDAISLMQKSRCEENNMNGLLLLSYPCIESYLISCNESLDFLPNNKKPKAYVGERGYKTKKLNKDKIFNGAIGMVRTMSDLGFPNAMESLDSFYLINNAILGKEDEIRRKSRGGYRLLSLLSIALIDLGILIVDDEE